MESVLDDAPVELILGLRYLRSKQLPLLEKLDHHNLDPDTLARYGNALSIEVAEFLNETPWKVWKKKEPDLDRVADEFADILAFLGTWLNLLELMGISVGRLAAAYDEKTAVNHRRLNGQVAHYGTPGGGYGGSGMPEPYANGSGDVQLAFPSADDPVQNAVAAIEAIRTAGTTVQETWNPKPGGILNDPLGDAEEDPEALDDD